MWLFGLALLGIWGIAEEIKLSADAKKKPKLQQEYEELFDFIFRKKYAATRQPYVEKSAMMANSAPNRK